MADAPGLSISAICPYATSTTCNSVLNDFEPHFIASGCRRYSCSVCGPRKKAQLARRIVTGRPNRLLTLTCRHEQTPREQLAVMRKATAKFVARIRKDYGEFEYCRVLETCNDGFPHFHLLARSGFLPQAQLRDWWAKGTGAVILDIRKAHGRSVGYVSKYISKATGEDGSFSRQKLAISRNFWEPQQGDSEFCNFDHNREHPTVYAKDRYENNTLERIRPGLYHVTDREPGDDMPIELLTVP